MENSNIEPEITSSELMIMFVIVILIFICGFIMNKVGNNVKNKKIE